MPPPSASDASTGAAPAPVRVLLEAAPGLPLRVADLVLDQFKGPDASGATLLVPDLRAAPALRRAFGVAAARRGHVVCLPPRIVTAQEALAEALNRSLPGHAVEPAARRAERLYGLVRAHGWYQRESLWDACAAVIALADELGEAQVAALDEGEWQRAIRAAYKRGVEHADSREARLVWEVWHNETASPAAISAQQSAGQALTPTVFSLLALKALGDKGAGPLFVLTQASLSRRWMQCMERYALREPVVLVEIAPPAWVDAVWGDADAPPSPPAVLPALRILAADSLEDEAGAVSAQVCAWLASGISNIGLIALDTLVARRARALLERRQVLLADEAGWPLSTTSAATAVMRWVEAVAGGMPSRTVLDWLKSPFVLGDMVPQERAVAIAALEDAVHRHDITRIGPALRGVADMPAGAQALIERLLAAQAAWPRGEAAFGAWMAALDASLDQLGVRAPLQNDSAGVEVLALIAQLVKALAPDPRQAGGARASLGEWRIFLSAQFERASFRNRRIDSPVVLTTLEGAQLRPFDAVLLIGAGAAHLGAAVPDDLFVNAALRSTLNLDSAEKKRSELHHRLGCLIGMAGVVAATWRRRQLDEAQPLSAPLARLELARRLGGAASGIEAVMPAPLPVRGHGTATPAPFAPGHLPARISVSAYANLLACPYRFFATSMLGLAEPDELEEELSKRDYGIWVHRVLKRFHEAHPLLQVADDEALVGVLEQIAGEVFAPLIAFNYLSLGWKLRLSKLFPAYIDWQREREQQGWRFDEGEAARVLSISVSRPDAVERDIDFVGRIDRIDRNAEDQTVALLDYKTQRLDNLKRRLRDAGEEAQLAGYAMFEAARGNTIAQTGLVSIDGDEVGLAPAQIDEPAERVRMETLLRAVEGGAALPANGVERVCAHCQARGLCRKDYWSALA